MAITFDSKIKELQEKKSELDVSILKSQKQEYEQRIAELLGGPVLEGGEKRTLDEVRDCYAKVQEIDGKIKQIPKNVEEIIKKIDAKIVFYQQKREGLKNIPPYKDTKEGIDDILLEDKVYQHAIESNDKELATTLKERSIKEEEYIEALKKMFNEVFKDVKDTEGEDSEKISKLIEEEKKPGTPIKYEEPKMPIEEDINQSQKKKTVKVAKPGNSIGNAKEQKKTNIEKNNSKEQLNKYIKRLDDYPNLSSGELFKLLGEFGWLDDYPKLSREELLRLLELKEKGNQEAANKIVLSFFRYLILYCSKFLSDLKDKYKCDYLDVKDLIMEGYFGLISAVEYFHMNRETKEDEKLMYPKFIKYVQCCIHSSLVTYLKYNGDVGRGISRRSPYPNTLGYPKGSIKKIDKYIDDFYQKNGRLPHSSEIVEYYEEEGMGDALHGEHFVKYYDGLHDGMIFSLDEIDDSSAKMIDPDSDTDIKLDQESLSIEIERALSTLTDREQEILKMFFGIGCPECSLDEIGEKLGLTSERTRQIKEKGIRRLRHSLRSKLLKPYLGNKYPGSDAYTRKNKSNEDF